MKKKVISLLLAALLLASLPATAFAAGLSNFEKAQTYTSGQFKDVSASSWYSEGVKVAYEYGLMNGTSAAAFTPEGNLTVSQAIVLAARLHSIYEGDGHVFETASPWYQSYLDYALKEGIIQSEYTNYGAGVTRADFAVILGGALPDAALRQINSIEDNAIPDVSSSASYASAVYRLYRAGILTGNDQYGTFTPDSKITRAAAATIVGRMADESLRKSFVLQEKPFTPVAINQLANLTSLKKKCTDAEFKEAYDRAVAIVTPWANLSREEQLKNIYTTLRAMALSGEVEYATGVAHYNDPYGYFVAGVSSCAGCARATGLCLNILGISYEHVNENQWSHQWCRVKMTDGSYWICDPYGMYVGEEPAPYTHPYLS